MGTVRKVFSVAPIGFDGHLVEVESDITKGLPGLQIVGLGNKAIDEAKERVRSAIANSLLEYPAKRVTMPVINFSVGEAQWLNSTLPKPWPKAAIYSCSARWPTATA